MTGELSPSERFIASKPEFMQDYWRRWFASEFERTIPGTRIARIRRGKYVRIPPEWRGKVPYGHRRRRRGDKLMRHAGRESIPRRKEPLLDDLDRDLLAHYGVSYD